MPSHAQSVDEAYLEWQQYALTHESVAGCSTATSHTVGAGPAMRLWFSGADGGGFYPQGGNVFSDSTR